MANSDLNRVINSDEIQSVVNAPKTSAKKHGLKKNPLKNLGAMLKLNPYAKTTRRMELISSVCSHTKRWCRCDRGTCKQPQIHVYECSLSWPVGTLLQAKGKKPKAKTTPAMRKIGHAFYKKMIVDR